MKTVCEVNKCTACMACADACPRKAVSLDDQLRYVNAVIDESKCIHCGLCEKVCQVKNPLPLQKPIEWFQGWHSDSNERKVSSSGGFTYALANTIISNGGYFASCRFVSGQFKYCITDSITELDDYRGSKYVKSNPSGVYSDVQKLLLEQKQVLFVGLPCHVAGLKRYLGSEYINLITVDLICHGSPSQNLLEMFLNQYGYSLKSAKEVSFRQKGNFRLTGEGIRKNGAVGEFYFTQPRIRDRYSISFLYGLTYTENCYQCPYAGEKRVSDITLGDSWGSELDEDNRKKGISLALCQTEKGIELLKRSCAELFEVDIDKAIAANHQLREPFPIPKSREIFFQSIEDGDGFNKAVRKSFPKACFRLDLKNFLLKSGILKDLTAEQDRT